MRQCTCLCHEEERRAEEAEEVRRQRAQELRNLVYQAVREGVLTQGDMSWLAKLRILARPASRPERAS